PRRSRSFSTAVVIQFGSASLRALTDRVEMLPASLFFNELAAKRLDFLRQLVPNSKNIAVLINADFGPSARFRADLEAATRALGLATPILQASKPSEIETAFDSLAHTQPDALLVGAGPIFRQSPRAFGGTRCRDCNAHGI